MTTTPTQAGAYTFFATAEYFAHLAADIARAKKGDRILLATMAFDPTIPVIGKLAAEIQAAARRGATIHLFIDAYNFLLTNKEKLGPLWGRTTLPHKLHGQAATLQDTLDQLVAAGVHVTLTNLPRSRWASPFSGRSHIKISIINDTIYLGGCNLEKQHFDCMVRWQDGVTAAWLYNLMLTRVEHPATRVAFGEQDIRHTISDEQDILIDVGVKKQSIIYKEALAVIDRAQDWLIITCQFFPNSATAKHLRAAYDRGVKVLPIFNHYSAHQGPNVLLQHAVTARERLRNPANFFAGELPAGTNYLHAKIIATEQEALIGSHNYVTAGVNFGTAEIAMHQKSSAFAKAAARLIVAETGLQQSANFRFLF